MKKSYGLGAALILVGAFSGAAQAATANFNGDAVVAAPITVATATSLNFGTVAAGATAGTVVITAAGTRSVTGGVTAAGGTVTAASFNVTGQPSAAYTITLPGAGNLTSGANTMGVTFATADLTGATTARTVNGAGTDTFSLGGTLAVGANQAAGAYAGTFTITVNY